MSDILTYWQTHAPNGAEVLEKALAESERVKLAEPKSALIDPYSNTSMSAGTRTKPFTIPYTTLRRMARVPAIAAILMTRKNQIARFARRPRFEGDMGFEIVLKDPQAKMTEAARKKAREIEEFFMKTGSVPNARRKDNFNQFLRKIVGDTLTIDAMVWENVPNLKGNLAEVWAVDAATIELVTLSPVSEMHTLPVYEPVTSKGRRIRGDIAYIQRVNGQVVAEYSEQELAYATRNPQTDLNYTDFGLSELEILYEIITAILNGVRYNTSYFSHSHLPQGVLEIVGKYSDKHLEGFKRHWQQLTSGAAGKWSVPILALEDGQGFKFTPFKNSNKDMEFNTFMEFLFNIACAVYQIDPNEVGFKSWTSSQGAATRSDNTEAKMEQSRDKGFVPLMNFLSDTFNSEIVDQIDPDFEFNWIGVDEQDEDKKLERQKLQLESGIKTVAMLWEENDYDMGKIKAAYGGELPSWAMAPANPQLIQVFMNEVQAAQQEEQQAQMAEQQAQGDPNAPNPEQEHAQQLEASEDAHGKELEKMEKEHEQAVEMEKLKHAHALEAKQHEAKLKPKPAPNKPLKKSLEPETVTVTISWDEY